MICNSFLQSLLPGIASELLSVDVSLLDPTSRKLRSLCHDELTFASKHGRFQESVASESGSFCYCLIRSMGFLGHAETQAIEGINSQIKMTSKRCPNISMELLSSRLVIKRHIAGADHNGGSKSGRRKWSSLRPYAEATVAALTAHSMTSLAVLTDTDRWALARAADFDDACKKGCAADDGADSVPICAGLRVTDMESLLSVRGSGCNGDNLVQGQGEVCEPGGWLASVSPAQIAWAKTYNVMWKRSTAPNKRQLKKLPPDRVVPKSCLSAALFQRPRVDIPELYLVVEKFSHSVQFSRLRSHTENGVNYVTWVYEEDNCVESTLFFMSFYDDCTRLGETIPARHCAISHDMCEKLFTLPGLPRAELAATSIDVMTITAGSASHTSARGRGRGKGRGRGRGRGRARAPLVCDEEGSVESDDNFVAYKEDAFANDMFNWEDMSDVNGSDTSSGLHDSDDDVSGQSAAVIKRAQEMGCAPTAEQVLDKVAEIQMDHTLPAVPDAELQEEALLLLLKQSKDHLLQAPRLDEEHTTKQTADHGLSSDDDAGLGDKHLIGEPYHSMMLRLSSQSTAGLCASIWMSSCLDTLRSMRVFAEHKNIKVGHQRSISHCQCVRCAWSDESNDIIFVHWLNNSDKCLDSTGSSNSLWSGQLWALLSCSV